MRRLRITSRSLKKKPWCYTLSQAALRSTNRVVVVVVVVVISPPVPQDGGTARSAIQVHAVNLIEIKLGKGGSPF